MDIKNKFGQKDPACRQAGQTLLIVVLVMVVGLTIGLSIVSKSITNVRTTTEEANSAQALAAAEAGVAQAIQTNALTGISSTYGNNASFTSKLTESAGQTTVLLNDGTIVPQDEGADLWLVPHDSSGLPVYSSPWGGSSVNIYWGDPTGPCEQAALEILVIKGSSLDPTSSRYALDPCIGRREGATGNNFTNPTAGGPYIKAEKSFSYTFQISVTSGLIARIIPIYNNAIIAVEDTSVTPAPFPSQGAVITSTGKAKDTTIQRKLNVFQGFSFLPIEYVNFGLVEH